MTSPTSVDLDSRGRMADPGRWQGPTEQPARWRTIVAAYATVLVRPSRGLRDIARSAPLTPPLTGLIAISSLGIGYSLTCLGVYLGGAVPLTAPVLPIAADEYYLWLAALTLPTFLAIWIAFAVAAWSVGRALGGRGSFLRLLDAAGVALALPVLVALWVPETILALLLVSGAIEWSTLAGWQTVPAWWVFDQGRQYGAVIWMSVLAVAALRETAGLSWARATLAGVSGLIPATAITALVIR